MRLNKVYNDAITVGSWVVPFRSEHLSGSRAYKSPIAIVVSVNPFHLMSECGGMYWCKDIKRDNFYVVDNKKRELPQKVVERMRKVGLNIPDEALNPTEMSLWSFRVLQNDPKLEFYVDGTFKTHARSIGHAYDKLKNRFPHATITQILEENEV